MAVVVVRGGGLRLRTGSYVDCDRALGEERAKALQG